VRMIVTRMRVVIVCVIMAASAITAPVDGVFVDVLHRDT